MSVFAVRCADREGGEILLFSDRSEAERAIGRLGKRFRIEELKLETSYDVWLKRTTLEDLDEDQIRVLGINL